MPQTVGTVSDLTVETVQAVPRLPGAVVAQVLHSQQTKQKTSSAYTFAFS